MAAWRTSVIRVIVTNPVYTGRVTYGLRAVGKFYRASAEGPQARSRAQFGRYERSPAARPVVVEGAHTSLVSPEAAAAFLAWEARERERRLAGGRQQIGNRHTARAEYLLSGLIRCTGCGCKFTGQRRLRKGIEYPDYLCSGFVGSGCRVCCRFVVPGEALDEYVLGEIRAQWRGTIDPERVRVQLAEAMGLGAGDGSGGPVEPIRRQISAIEARMVTIATNLDPEHAAVANDAIKRLKVDRAALARRLEEAETRASSSRKIEDLVTRLVALLDDAPALWQAASPHRRRVLVRSFVAGIAVDPARGTVAVDFWRVPKVTTARDPLEGAASRGVGLVAGVDSSRYAPTRQVVLRVLPGRELRPAG